MTNNERQVNRVKWFNDSKGFGFIEGSDGDVFVHYRSIEPGTDGFKTLEEGEMVEYLQVQSERGWSAVEVRKVEGSKPKAAKLQDFDPANLQAIASLLAQMSYDDIHAFASSDDEAEIMTVAAEKFVEHMSSLNESVEEYTESEEDVD